MLNQRYPKRTVSVIFAFGAVVISALGCAAAPPPVPRVPAGSRQSVHFITKKENKPVRITITAANDEKASCTTPCTLELASGTARIEFAPHQKWPYFGDFVIGPYGGRFEIKQVNRPAKITAITMGVTGLFATIIVAPTIIGAAAKKYNDEHDQWHSDVESDYASFDDKPEFNKNAGWASLGVAGGGVVLFFVGYLIGRYSDSNGVTQISDQPTTSSLGKNAPRLALGGLQFAPTPSGGGMASLTLNF